MFLLPTPVWVLMTLVTGLGLLVVEPSGAARTVGASALAGMVLAGLVAGLREAAPAAPAAPASTVAATPVGPDTAEPPPGPEQASAEAAQLLR